MFILAVDGEHVTVGAVAALFHLDRVLEASHLILNSVSGSVVRRDEATRDDGNGGPN